MLVNSKIGNLLQPLLAFWALLAFLKKFNKMLAIFGKHFQITQIWPQTYGQSGLVKHANLDKTIVKILH